MHAEVDEAVLHLLQAGGLGREANGHLAVGTGVGRVEVDVVRHRNRAQVGRNRLLHVEHAADRVAPEAVRLDQVALSVKAFAAGARDAVCVGRPLAELVKAGVPGLAVVWGIVVNPMPRL